MSAVICLLESFESLWYSLVAHYKLEKITDSCTSFNYQPISVISGNELEPITEKDSTLALNQTNQLIKTEEDQQQLQSSTDNCCRATTNSLAINGDSQFLKWMFDLIDENKDGFVSIEEIKVLLERLGCAAMSEEAIATALFLHPDISNYNETQHLPTQFDLAQFSILYESIICEVPKTEFYSTEESTGTEEDFSEASSALTEEDFSDLETGEDELVYDAFRLYDKNGDGFISASEMACVLTELGLLKDLSNTQSKYVYCQTLIDRVDINGDGLVDFDEFKLMMQNSPF